MANYRLRIGFPSGYQLTAVSGSYVLTGQTAVLSFTSGVTPASDPPFIWEYAGGSGQFTIIWFAPSQTADTYNVRWGQTAGQQDVGGVSQGAGRIQTGISALTLNKTGLSPTGTYYITVSDVKGGIESNVSNEISVTVT